MSRKNKNRDNSSDVRPSIEDVQQRIESATEAEMAVEPYMPEADNFDADIIGDSPVTPASAELSPVEIEPTIGEIVEADAFASKTAEPIALQLGTAEGKAITLGYRQCCYLHPSVVYSINLTLRSAGVKYRIDPTVGGADVFVSHRKDDNSPTGMRWVRLWRSDRRTDMGGEREFQVSLVGATPGKGGGKNGRIISTVVSAQ
jgi:hypothetical protein